MPDPCQPATTLRDCWACADCDPEGRCKAKGAHPHRVRWIGQFCTVSWKDGMMPVRGGAHPACPTHRPGHGPLTLTEG